MPTNTRLLPLMSSFSAVVNAGSFTKAATHLGLSKSVVSRHVSTLERKLGVQLLYRSTHRLSLTETGERFYAYCKDLDDVAEQALAAAAAAKETPSGLLRATLPQTLVVSPLGALITRFQTIYPDVQLDVRVTSLQVDPIEEGFDLALRIGTLADSSLIYRKIRDVRFRAVATPGYLETFGRPRTPEDLREHNCLTYSEFAARGRGTFGGRGTGKKPVELAGNLSTNSGVLLMQALLSGQGIAIGPDIMFEEQVERHDLEIILDEYEPEAAELYAVFPPGRFASAGRKAFVDFLAANLAA
jgi:DNA-binding transcriptional LysR family regulator